MAHTAAVIDVGSNTVRLLVARCDARTLAPTYTERVGVGLGHEIERDEYISETSMQATADAVRELSSHPRTLAAESLEVLVTAPGRQARNGKELVAAIERAIRRPVRSLSAQDEAALSFTGAVALAAPSEPVVAVVDLGGASTEIAVGTPEGGPAWVRSIDLGALRLRARLLDEEEPDQDQVDAARTEVAEAFAGVTPPLPGAALVVGGNARALGRVLGPRLRRGVFEPAIAILPACTPDAIESRFGIGKRRAALLLATALILAEVQRRLIVPLEVAEGGVREGALLLSARDAAA